MANLNADKRILTCEPFLHQVYRLIARNVMAAMLVVWNNKIFLLWGLTSIFLQTMLANFLLF